MQSMTATRSGLAGSALVARTRSTRVQARSGVRVMAAQGYQWLNKEPIAIMAGFLGWFAPSNIQVPAFGGQSLFGAFTKSIGEELAHFPTVRMACSGMDVDSGFALASVQCAGTASMQRPRGPALTSDFWILMVTWHIGLFACLFWGQIGVQARKQGYFD
ncbi:hypothetical protein ABPG77_002187 [Micractinium sp. CCAP 211/92]